MKFWMVLTIFVSPVYEGRIYEYVEDNAGILSEETIESFNELNDIAKRSNNGYVKLITEKEYVQKDVLLEDKAIALIYYADIHSVTILYGQDAKKYLNRSYIESIVNDNLTEDFEKSIKKIMPKLITELVESYPNHVEEKPMNWIERIKHFFSNDDVEIQEGKKMTFIDQLEYYLNTPDGKTILSLIMFMIPSFGFIVLLKKRIG